MHSLFGKNKGTDQLQLPVDHLCFLICKNRFFYGMAHGFNCQSLRHTKAHHFTKEVAILIKMHGNVPVFC